MGTYKMMNDKELADITKEQLAAMYNDAVETIWIMDHHIKELEEENENVWKAYEDVSNELYG